MHALQLAQALQQIAARHPRVLHQLFVVHDIENFLADHAGKSRAAEGREELGPAGEALGDLTRRDHHAKGMPVADGLAEHHDVGDDTLLLESEVEIAKSSEPGLNFVRDADATGSANAPVHARQISGRRDDLPAHTGERLGDETREPAAARVDASDGVVHLRSVLLGAVGIAAAKAAAVVVGQLHELHPLRPAAAARGVELVRRDRDGAGGIAVVAVIGRDHVQSARVSARDPECELVALRTGVHEEADRERFRQLGSDLLRERTRRRMQIARVGIEPLELLRCHRADARMRMADVRDVVVAVQIRSAPLVEEKVLPSAQEHHRMCVRQLQVSAEVLDPLLENRQTVQRVEGGALVREIQQRCGVRKDPRP